MTVLTLWDGPDLLRERAVRRRRDLWKKMFPKGRIRAVRENYLGYRDARRRRAHMHPFFEEPERLHALYLRWFDYCAGRGLRDHWLSRPSAGPNPAPLDTPSIEALERSMT